MKKELQFGQSDLASSLAMNLKSEEDVSEMARMLSKVAIERALEIEMEEHLGEKSHGRRKNGNSRKVTNKFFRKF